MYFLFFLIMFIVFEGIDCSGKTTVAKKLLKLLKNKKIDSVLTKEPAGTKLGEKIKYLISEIKHIKNSYLEYFLFSVDRVIHINEIIQPNLKKNKVVICDRFLDSSKVYQGIIGGIDQKFIDKIYGKISLSIKPDLTIYCHANENIILNRISKRKNPTGFDIEVKEKIQNYLKSYEELYKKKKNIIFIDTEENINKNLEIILNKIINFKNKKIY
jgi:dTMP kinase